MLARASPLKPYVVIELRSLNSLSLDVVNLSHRISMSSFYSNQPLTCTVMSVANMNSGTIISDLQ